VARSDDWMDKQKEEERKKARKEERTWTFK
jgi:hypothetical protein